MIFNGQGVRFDGNFDLPTRVAEFKAIPPLVNTRT
jgi:hypothetical protein